jgi:hypothetical protein
MSRRRPRPTWPSPSAAHLAARPAPGCARPRRGRHRAADAGRDRERRATCPATDRPSGRAAPESSRRPRRLRSAPARQRWPDRCVSASRTPPRAILRLLRGGFVGGMHGLAASKDDGCCQVDQGREEHLAGVLAAGVCREPSIEQLWIQEALNRALSYDGHGASLSEGIDDGGEADGRGQSMASYSSSTSVSSPSPSSCASLTAGPEWPVSVLAPNSSASPDNAPPFPILFFLSLRFFPRRAPLPGLPSIGTTDRQSTSGPPSLKPAQECRRRRAGT